MAELHHPPNGISSRFQDSAFNPTTPDDVLTRLKGALGLHERFLERSMERPLDVGSMRDVLRDAVAEIEHLRAGAPRSPLDLGPLKEAVDRVIETNARLSETIGTIIARVPA
jgi:hypothetical protein